MQKIYLAAPFTHNLDNNFLEDMENWLISKGHSVIVPHKFASNVISQFAEESKLAFSSINSCDVLLADVSKPSHGVGIEILHANRSGKNVILIMQSGTRLSGLAHVLAHNIIEYDNTDDLKIKLDKII